MNNFFTKVVRKRGGESNPVVIADSSTSSTPPATPTPEVPPAAKHCKKTDSLDNRLKSLQKNKTEGNWRKHELMSVPLPWTEVIQRFEHLPSGEVVEIHHFAPYGMVHFIEQQKSTQVALPAIKASPKRSLLKCVGVCSPRRHIRKTICN